MKFLLKNGCWRSKISISPENYKSLRSKADLQKNWFVQCRFHDPAFKDIPKYKNGFLYRIKVNSFPDLNERKIAAETNAEIMQRMLDYENYNPITQTHMHVGDSVLDPEMLFFDALRLVEIPGATEYIKEVNRALNRLEITCEKLHYSFLRISDVKIFHIKNILEKSELTPYMYNKYRTYLLSKFKQLIEYGCIESNPVRDISKKKTEKKIRAVLSETKRRIVFDYIDKNYPYLFRYLNIFFLSGGRTSELFRVQRKHVDLANQEYDCLIKKGKSYVWVKKIIMLEALPFWEEQMSLSKNSEDFLFSRSLLPGLVHVNPRQMSRRWERLIKDSDKILDQSGTVIKITEDFYAFKHFFLDKLDEHKHNLSPIIPINYAKEMANHKSDGTTDFYTIGKDDRNSLSLKNMRTNFLKTSP